MVAAGGKGPTGGEGKWRREAGARSGSAALTCA